MVYIIFFIRRSSINEIGFLKINVYAVKHGNNTIYNLPSFGNGITKLVIHIQSLSKKKNDNQSFNMLITVIYVF